MPAKSLPIIPWNLIEPEPNTGCWLWVGVWIWGGYGRITRGRKHLAHRWMYMFLVDPSLPAEVDLLHSCDVPCCVNPAHLKPGTASQNLIDACMRGRASYAKLTPAAVATIRQRVAAGETQTAVARDYNLHQATVSRAVTRDTWVQVEG